jgi:hypothetical protein
MTAQEITSAVTQPVSQKSERFVTLLNNSPFLSSAVTDPKTKCPLPQHTTCFALKAQGLWEGGVRENNKIKQKFFSGQNDKKKKK